MQDTYINIPSLPPHLVSEDISLDHHVVIHPSSNDELNTSADVEELQRAFSVERRDIEDAFKMEVSELEEQHNEMVELLQQRFIQEQVSGRRLGVLSFLQS